MKKFYLLLSPLSIFCCAYSSFALPDYEPFSDSTGSGGTSYADGSPLAGQTNANGQSWFTAGTGTPQPTIAAGDLTISGLASASGGHSAAFGGTGNNARINLSVGSGGISSGTVYYSLAMKLTDLTGLASGGQFFFGFNNTQGSQATTPNTVVTRLETRSAGTGIYNIGLQEGSAGTLGNLTWGSQNFTTSDTVFIVGSYTFNPSTGDDVSQLWINPSSTTFGAGSAPTATLLSSGGTDIARIASAVLYDRGNGAGLIDDLRFGTNWSDVTPAVVPEPATVTLGGLGIAGLCLRRLLRRKS